MIRGVFLLLLCPAIAGAVIISGTDGTRNTEAPPNDPGWANVGRIDAGSKTSTVTYLGDKWFITAHHVYHFDNPTGIVINSTSHAIDPISWTRLTNSTGPDADLMLFQTVTRPSTGAIRIRTEPITNQAPVIMIGNGRNRTNNLTYWDSSWEVTNAISGVYSGYVWAAGSAKRWGENVVVSTNSFTYSYGPHQAAQFGFQTTFDPALGSNVCQGATFDSGGAVFHHNGSDWELAGIMLTVSTHPGQPSSRAVYGNQTFMADISYYRPQIAATMPNFDSDADGLPDWWELQHSGSITGMVASADLDGDGFTNLQEYIADTNPTNSLSFPVLSAEVDEGVYEFSFSGSTNRLHQVLYSTNSLTDPAFAWNAVNDPELGAGTNTVIGFTNQAPSILYRLRITLP